MGDKAHVVNPSNSRYLGYLRCNRSGMGPRLATLAQRRQKHGVRQGISGYGAAWCDAEPLWEGL